MRSACFFCKGKVGRINVLILWKFWLSSTTYYGEEKLRDCYWFERGCAGEICCMKILLSHQKLIISSVFFLCVQGRKALEHCQPIVL